jgi:hypothetical protein
MIEETAEFMDGNHVWLQEFIRLSKLTVELPVSNWLLNSPRRQDVFPALMNRVQKKVGVQKHLVPQLPHGQGQTDVWVGMQTLDNR